MKLHEKYELNNDNRTCQASTSIIWCRIPDLLKFNFSLCQSLLTNPSGCFCCFWLTTPCRRQLQISIFFPPSGGLQYHIRMLMLQLLNQAIFKQITAFQAHLKGKSQRGWDGERSERDLVSSAKKCKWASFFLLQSQDPQQFFLGLQITKMFVQTQT